MKMSRRDQENAQVELGVLKNAIFLNTWGVIRHQMEML